MVLPDQVARLRVERLDDVHRVGEIDDAVVHDRRRLVRLPFVHAPDPRELQLLHVVARDLRQRTVAPALIVAPHHQPVARILAAQHLVGDRYEVLHLAGDRQAQRTGVAGRSAPRQRTSSARRAAPASSSAAGRRRRIVGRRRLCLSGSGATRGGGAACDGSDRRGRRRRECLGARRRAVRLQDERGDRDVLIGAQARACRRHRGLDVLEKIARGARAPRAHEVGARKLRRFVAPAQIGQVAARAVRLIHGAAGRRLIRGVDARSRLLTRDERDRHRRRDRERNHALHLLFSCGMIHPQRLPSGAFSLWSCT